MLFDIQHYAVHDGPGIRTLVFLKGCPLRCAWCANPESQRPAPEVRHLSARCRACLRCADACPRGAIAAIGGVPRIQRDRCAGCDRTDCVAACPERALVRAGEEWSLDDVIARVAADRDFYRNSGGGVTFSGGEPFAQARFLLAALARCRSLGIHTAVETCGHASPDDLDTAEPLVDLFLFDLKVADPDRHRALTGTGNALILDNLRQLAGRGADRIVVRVPVVPGLTDSAANVEALASLTASLGIARAELCAYHPLGRAKYVELGLPEPPDPPAPTPEALERVADAFVTRGVACTCA
jgi:pyruvate formate lyase activating enzyme